MAIELAVEDVKRTDELMVWPDDIEVDWKSSGRFFKTKPNDPETEELARKIIDQGQLQSIGCRRGPDKKLYLAFGFRRWTAIKLINEKLQPDNPMRVRVHLFPGNEADAFTRNITENRDRRQVTVLDDANNQNILRERFQWDDEKIATFYGCTTAYVGQLATILLLCEAVKKAIQSGFLAPTAALKLAQQGLNEEQQHAILESLLADQPKGDEPVDGKKSKKKKASTSKVEDAIRDQKSGAGKDGPARRVTHVKKYFAEILTCKDEPEPIKNFAEILLKWIDGKKTDQQLSNALSKLKQ